MANISYTHALYAEGDGFRIRLPRMDRAERARRGLVRAAGNGAGRLARDAGRRPAAAGGRRVGPAGQRHGPRRRWQTAGGDPTLLPLYLDPNTKLFLVALIWCRPWLIDPARGMPLPRTPEIARAALEVTGAQHEIECFDSDPPYRDRLAARVGEHLKVLRRKIIERGLVRPGVRLSDEVVVGALIENGIISPDRPGPVERPGLVLEAGGPVVDAGDLTDAAVVRAAKRAVVHREREHAGRPARSPPPR